MKFLEVHSDHNLKLPALVTLINSFLHFQTSPLVDAHSVFTQHLHAVVAHFAGLGPVARNYLLKTRTLARLLRILLSYNNSQPNLPPSHTNEASFMYQNLPLIEIARVSEQEKGIGYLTPNPLMTNLDSKALQKERAQIAQNMSSPMIFVVLTISILVRSCRFVNSTAPHIDNPENGAQSTMPQSVGRPELYNGLVDPTNGDCLGHNLDKDELDLLINYLNNRVWWRASA